MAIAMPVPSCVGWKFLQYPTRTTASLTPPLQALIQRYPTPQKAVIDPVGRQRFHDIESAVVGDDLAVIQIIPQICDLREIFTFHNNKGTDRSFFGDVSPPRCLPKQSEAQAAKRLVVEHGSTVGCKQSVTILNDFLSTDRGQPLSGCFLSVNFTKKRLRFLQCMSDFRLQPRPETTDITKLLGFVHGRYILYKKVVMTGVLLQDIRFYLAVVLVL